MSPYLLDQPVKFPGTAEEIAANKATHNFDPHENRCIDCDCRPGGRIAEYPCGVAVPREQIRMGGNENA